MSKRPRFEKFVNNLPATNKISVLPLTHGTTAHNLRDMMDKKEIRPFLCDTLGKEVVFTFYGRPAYRPKNTEQALYQEVGAPVFLILSPDLIAKSGLAHPFDTGANNSGLYEAFLGDAPTLADFSFDPTQTSLPALVGRFYGDNRSYLKNSPDRFASFNGDEFEAKAYHAALMDARRKGSGDERASTIEIAISDKISIEKKHILFAIVPDVLIDGGDTIEALIEAEISIEPYMFRPGMSWSNYMSQIYSLVEGRYKSGKLL